MEEISLCALFIILYSYIYKSKILFKILVRKCMIKDYHRRLLGYEGKYAYNILA